MSDTKFTETLTRDNVAVILADHQVALYSGVRDVDLLTLKHNVAALSRAAQVLGLPTVYTTTMSGGMWGQMIPELAETLPEGTDVIDRSAVNAWHDSRVRDRIKATERKKLIFAGVSLEVCASLPAMAAAGEGYDTYVAADACGTFSSQKHETGIVRLEQAGVIASDYATLMVEVLDDNLAPEAEDVYAALDMPFVTLVGQVANSYSK